MPIGVQERVAANGSLHLRRFITAKCTQIPFRTIKSLEAAWLAREEAEYPHGFHNDDYDIDLCVCVFFYICEAIDHSGYFCYATTMNSENQATCKLRFMFDQAASNANVFFLNNFCKKYQYRKSLVKKKYI